MSNPQYDALPFDKPPAPLVIKTLPMQVLSESIYNELYNRGVSLTLPEWWDWGWMADDKEHGYSGTFPKRVANYFYKGRGEKMAEKTVSVIGEVHKRLVKSDGIEFVVDVDKGLDWKAGDFSDPSSCFWSDRKGARTMLRNAGGFAFRRWILSSQFQNETDEETEEGDLNMPLVRAGCVGKGRCWGMPLKNQGIVIFNCYDLEFQLNSYAQALAQLIGVTGVRKIELVNGGSTGGRLYINSGLAYLVGESEYVRKHESRYDMNIPYAE